MCLIRPIDDLFQHFIHIFSYVWSDRIFFPFKLDYNWRGFLFGIMLLLPCFLFCMCNKSLGCAGFFFFFLNHAFCCTGFTKKRQTDMCVKRWNRYVKSDFTSEFLWRSIYFLGSMKGMELIYILSGN